MSDADIIRNKFLPWYRTHGDQVRALGYGSARSQEVRFEQFLRGFDLVGASILDVGCGFGDLFPFMTSRGVAPRSYIGVDLLEEFVLEARRRVTDERCRFATRNFIEDPVDDLSVEYAIACAALNTNLPNRDDFVKKFLTRMWEVSSKGFGFSMECSHYFKGRTLDINLDPAYWLDYVCRTFTHRLVLFSDYHDADFTIFVFK